MTTIEIFSTFNYSLAFIIMFNTAFALPLPTSVHLARAFSVFNKKKESFKL